MRNEELTLSYTPPWDLHGEEVKVWKFYALSCFFPEPLQRDVPKERMAGPGVGDGIGG